MKFDFEGAHRANFKRQGAHLLSLPTRNRTDDKDVENAIPVLAIEQQSFEDKIQQACNYQDLDNTVTVFFQSYLIITAKFDNVELPTLADFIVAQSKDAFCDQMKQLVETPNCLLTFDSTELLLRQTPLDGPVQKLVPLSLCIQYYTWRASISWWVTPANVDCTTSYVKTTTGAIWTPMLTIRFNLALIVP